MEKPTDQSFGRSPFARVVRPAIVVTRSERGCRDSGTTPLQERAPATDLGRDPAERVLSLM
jgi:hypothetical protein